ncbi:MAG: hypothetical protein ACM3NO_01735, partial [Deltaproteobacteria bacterium]
MRFPFSARLGAYFALFGILCQLYYLHWLSGSNYSYLKPFIPLPILMFISYGAVLFIRPTIAQFWERDDLFERATRRGFIASAAGPWNVSKEKSGARIQKSESRSNVPNFEFRFSNFIRVSPLRRSVPPELYRLKPATLAFCYALPLTLMVATFVLGRGYGRSWVATHTFGLRVYVAGPSGFAAPGFERREDQLRVKVTYVPEWFMGSKQIGEQEALRIRKMPERRWRGTLESRYHRQWFLNSTPMTREEVQKALR